MTFQQFLLILRARWLVILLTFMVVVGTAVGVSLVMPKKYAASAAVLVYVKTPDPILGALIPGMMTPGYMATEIDIIQSDRVARRVVQMLKIDQNASARQQWQEETAGRGSIEAYFADLLSKQLDVKPSRESNVINITYKSGEPQFAAVIANAFAQAYIDTNVELRVDPAAVERDRRRERQDGVGHERDAAAHAEAAAGDLRALVLELVGQAQHGFFCDARPSYDAEAAKEAWGLVTAFLATNLA